MRMALEDGGYMERKTIRELREQRGWSQFELAVKVGVTPGAVGKWERGISEPKATQLRSLAEAFGVLMDQIELVDSSSKMAA
jgi:transcriptional regulator with XRE-family HTH domain